MFTGGNVTLMVADLERSLRFYTETLGLPPGYRAGEHWAEVKGPGLTIGLHPSSADTPPPGAPPSISLGLTVADLETARAELEDRGIVFHHASADASVKLAHFLDPDGYACYLCQLLFSPSM